MTVSREGKNRDGFVGNVGRVSRSAVDVTLSIRKARAFALQQCDSLGSFDEKLYMHSTHETQ